MEKDRKHYNKQAPLAEHAKELTKSALDGRIHELRDSIARQIINACQEGKTELTFDKYPDQYQVEYGITNAVWTEAFQELTQKGYKLDYSGDKLKVSWG